MVDLTIYGHSETDCLNHSVAWMNYALETHARDEANRIKLRERLRLQAAMLTGIMFNDPEKGQEVYESMMGQLGDEGDDAGDEAFLTNPNATTDLAALEKVIQRRIDDQRRAGLRSDGDPADGNAASDGTGIPGTTASTGTGTDLTGP